MAHRPVVDEGVPRAGVEGNQLVIAGADPGDIGDPAEIEHGKRPRQRLAMALGKRAVEQARERRPLPARARALAATAATLARSAAR